MITFLINLGCIVAKILALIGLFILAYKIPRLFLNHYAKNHNMTLDELLNKHDQFSDLSSSLGALDYLLVAFITSNVLTVFATLGDASLGKILSSLLLLNFVILIILDIYILMDLSVGHKRISEYLNEQLLKKSIKI